MSDTARLPVTHPAFLVATWGGAGLLRPAPGSWGSLFALPFAFGLQWLWGPIGLGIATVVAALLGLWATSIYLARVGGDDPGAVVIDEVAGQWIAVLPAATDLLMFGIGFFLFRFFDIVKPWPISKVDRDVKGSLGVMADDLLAGVAAAVLLAILRPLVI